jgi:hypothetical protein
MFPSRMSTRRSTFGVACDRLMRCHKVNSTAHQTFSHFLRSSHHPKRLPQRRPPLTHQPLHQPLMMWPSTSTQRGSATSSTMFILHQRRQRGKRLTKTRRYESGNIEHGQAFEAPVFSSACCHYLGLGLRVGDCNQGCSSTLLQSSKPNRGLKLKADRDCREGNPILLVSRHLL